MNLCRISPARLWMISSPPPPSLKMDLAATIASSTEMVRCEPLSSRWPLQPSHQEGSSAYRSLTNVPTSCLHAPRNSNRGRILQKPGLRGNTVRRRGVIDLRHLDEHDGRRADWQALSGLVAKGAGAPTCGWRDSLKAVLTLPGQAV